MGLLRYPTHLGQIFIPLFSYSQRYIALFAWTVTVWVTFNVLIDSRQNKNASPKAVHAIDLISKLLFSFFVCAAVLLFEKFAIQWIAGKFHERSYAGTHFFFFISGRQVDGGFSPERIADQKFAVRSFVTLYKNSMDIPGHTDTLPNAKNSSVNPKRLFKKLKEGVRFATTTTATVFGNVASEIAGRYGKLFFFFYAVSTLTYFLYYQLCVTTQLSSSRHQNGSRICK